ncbi:MAG TPA: hypothetical protein VIJ93_14530, partial [bacterium]
MIGIIVPAITYLFTKVTQGMAADEMHIQLQSLNEQTMLRVHERLVAGRHLFQNDQSGVSFLNLVTAAAGGMSATTRSNFPILAGSKLALEQPIIGSGSFSPVTATRANFGNSLFFGTYDASQSMGSPYLPYFSPATISGASISYGSGQAATVVFDLYRFYYYYLTTVNPKSLRNVATYRLVEWQSIQYADLNEINDIGDPTLQTAAISWLATPGNVSPGNAAYAVTWAWDPTQTDPNKAFYTSTAASGVFTPFTPMTKIFEGVVNSLTRVSSGILSTGFFYGISPNSALWTASPVVVPQFGIAAASFPSGFEVGISGSSAGREVMIRSLLVAQGSAPKIIWNDQTMVHNVRDTW